MVERDGARSRGQTVAAVDRARQSEAAGAGEARKTLASSSDEQHVRCARVREHAGSITTPSTTTRPRRRPWQGGGRGAVECTWCMGVCSGAQLSRSPYRQPRTRRTSTRARARTHLKLLSDTASLPVLQPDTLAGLPWGGVLLPRGCFVVVNEGWWSQNCYTDRTQAVAASDKRSSLRTRGCVGAVRHGAS